MLSEKKNPYRHNFAYDVQDAQKYVNEIHIKEYVNQDKPLCSALLSSAMSSHSTFVRT